MFTGLIQEVGVLKNSKRTGPDAELTVAASFECVEIGESIALNGACLSATKWEPGRFVAFASRETLEKTGLAELAIGSRVNLERALRLGDSMGGHMVTGHVDERVRLMWRKKIGRAEHFCFSMPSRPLDSHIVSKGSVALNGVSFTVNDVRNDDFDAMIIPLTLENTTLGELRPGDMANIETDVLAKYVARQMIRDENRAGSVDMELLRRTGFVR